MRILWIPHASWRTPQRARWFCQELAQRHTVHVTDWVADFRSPREYLSRRYLRNFTYRLSRDGEIVVHGIPRVAPALFVPLLRKLNSALFARYLSRIISRERIDVVVGSFVAPPPRALRLVLDVADDNVGYWLAGARFLDYARDIARVEGEYLRKADAVVAVSSVLVDRLRARVNCPPIALIPNGVRIREFHSGARQSVRSQLQLNGPVVGLIGNHDKWPELERVLEAAKILRGSGCTFLVVGSGAAVKRAQHAVSAARLGNVRFVGRVAPDQVAGYFAAIDVGLCPYTTSSAADAASPMRLLSHSAAGSPVVCTPLEEVRRMGFSNVLLVDPTPRAITEGIRRALALPRQRPPQIYAYELELLARRYEAVLAGDVAPGPLTAPDAA